MKDEKNPFLDKIFNYRENKRLIYKGKQQKPPLGPVPEMIYQEKRLEELARAIHEYISQGFFTCKYAIRPGVWCEELSMRLKEFE